jgi:hypothetical protein
LREKDAALHGRLAEIAPIAEKTLVYTQSRFPTYTLHDFGHSQRVVTILDWLVPDAVKTALAAEELFFLILGAWFHDCGMIAPASDQPDAVREEHHVRSESLVVREHNEFRLDDAEARFIGRIGKGHRRVDLTRPEYGDLPFGSKNVVIRQGFLAACVRLADELDITYWRTPEAVVRAIQPTGRSAREFRNHLNVLGVGLSGGGDLILVNAIAHSPEEKATLRTLEQKIKATLDSVRIFLEAAGITISGVRFQIQAEGFVDEEVLFKPDTEAILKLLMGEYLYGRPDACVRELVQNAIDSCTLRGKLEGPAYIPEITLELTPARQLVVRDNGYGMDLKALKDFFANVGQSFYTSREFQGLLESKGIAMQPISNFGIGVLACFMIGDEVTVETRRPGQPGLRVTIAGLTEEFQLRQAPGSLPVGTTVTVGLKPDAQLDLTAAASHYFRHLARPIKVTENGRTVEVGAGEFRPPTATEGQGRRPSGWDAEDDKLESRIWDFDEGDIRGRFFYDPRESRRGEGRLCVLSQEGIYVADRPGLIPVWAPESLSADLVVRRGIVDLQVSREGVVENDRWRDLQRRMDGLTRAALRGILADVKSTKDLTDPQKQRVAGHLFELLERSAREISGQGLDSLEMSDGEQEIGRLRADLFNEYFLFFVLPSNRLTSLNDYVARSRPTRIRMRESDTNRMVELPAVSHPTADDQRIELLYYPTGPWEEVKTLVKGLCADKNVAYEGSFYMEDIYLPLAEFDVIPSYLDEFLPGGAALVRIRNSEIEVATVDAMSWESRPEFSARRNSRRKPPVRPEFIFNLDDALLALLHAHPEVLQAHPERRELMQFYFNVLTWSLREGSLWRRFRRTHDPRVAAEETRFRVLVEIENLLIEWLREAIGRKMPSVDRYFERLWYVHPSYG